MGLTSGDFWKPTLVAGDGKVYTSDTTDNLNGLDHMIAFEDLPDLGDEDYNDHVIEINFTAVQTSSVPEPAALSLFGLGIVGLGLMRRRRKVA